MTLTKWTARINDQYGTREFEIIANAVGPRGNVAVVYNRVTVARFDAAVTIYRDRWTARIAKVVVTGDGHTEEHRSIKGALEAWAGAAAFAFMNQYQR